MKITCGCTVAQLDKEEYAPGYGRYVDMINRQGPRYQYGTGCLSDDVLGFWMARMCGLDGNIVDRASSTATKSGRAAL